MHLSGVIDETLDLGVFTNVAGALVIDLDAVRRVTSYGVRQWARALKATTASYLVVRNARPCIVAQLNSVAGFLGNADLSSLYVPFVCSKCRHEFDVLYDVRKDWAAMSSGDEPHAACTQCGAAAELDDLPESYFFFAKTLRQPQLPPAVATFLDGKPAQVVHRAFRVGKDVDGPVTALWLTGTLDETARFKRVADGIEGHVVLVGSELAGAVPQGAARLRDFLEGFGREIWLARFDEAVLVLLEATGELPANVRVVTQAHSATGAVRDYLATHAAPPLSVSPPSESGVRNQFRAGKYRLLHHIGQGGMAEVFVGQLDGPGGFEKKVVIKRILAHLANDAEFVEMFLQEARLAARLSHPNVVQIFEVGSDGGDFFIAMEYVKGVDLGVLLRAFGQMKEQLPLGIVLQIANDLCAGLDAAHSWCDDTGKPSPIIHRDISPHNIIVASDGHSKLADFGVAKALDQDSLTPTTTLKGKLAYMAPEQADTQAASPLDHRTDLFSVGVVLYQLLTLQQPFRRDSEAATLYALLNQTPPAPSTLRPGIPEGVDRIVRRALERSPDKRFASAREFHAALQKEQATVTERTTPADVANWLRETIVRIQEVTTVRLPTGAGSGPGVPADDDKTPVTTRSQLTRS